MDKAEKVANLKAARGVLAVPGQWCKYVFARDAAGNSQGIASNGLYGFEAECAAWCMAGALYKVLGSNAVDYSELRRELHDDTAFGINRLNDYADDVTVVLESYDRTIARLEASV